MEQQGKKKRRKVPSGSGGQRETAITLSSAILSDPLQHMVGFVDHPGRLNLALSCKSMHRTVEVYCKAALAKIEQEHHVDETFAERLRDPSRIGGLQQPVSGEELSYRYLLKAARFTYLYTLEMMKGSSGLSCASALSKDGRRLVVAATLPLNRRPPISDPNCPPLFVYSWDVTAKPGANKIYEIPAETREYEIKDAFCTEEVIVTCTNRRILTLAIDTLDLTHAYTHPTGVHSVIWQGATGVVVFLDDDDKVYSFDVSTGMAESVAQLTLNPQDYNSIEGILNDRWLVVYNCMIGTHEGFRVFDLSNGCRQSCCFRGGFIAVEQSTSCPDTFYTFDFGRSQVLQLSKQGKFSIVRSFILPFPNESYWQEGPQSRWFFEKNKGGEASMTVRCSNSGECQGSYKLPANHGRAYGMDIQWNGNKLFVGLENKRERDGVCIAAFLAKEHF